MNLREDFLKNELDELYRFLNELEIKKSSLNLLPTTIRNPFITKLHELKEIALFRITVVKQALYELKNN
jgi:hypothetical protein